MPAESPDAPTRSRIGWWLLGAAVAVVFGLVLVVGLRVRSHEALVARAAARGCFLGVNPAGPDWLQRVVPLHVLEAFGPVRAVIISGESPLSKRLSHDGLHTLVEELRHRDSVSFVVIDGVPQLTDAGFRAIRRLPTVTDLRVFAVPLTDAAFVDLARDLPRLQCARLDYFPIGDATAIELSRLPELEELSLDGTQVGDAGAAALATAPSLRRLSLSDTYVTDVGIARLVDRIPELQVSDD